MSRPRPVILDISEHQLPIQINYRQVASAIDWVIVRVQYGSLYEDRQYLSHIKRFQELGVPINVYAWVRGLSVSDMRQEAETFYRRVFQFKPSFWWLDIEERSMDQMVAGCEVYRQQLKALGAKKVGAYIANHLYHPFGFTKEAVAKFDALWLPSYGQNTGGYQGINPTANREYDLHQYTNNGRLPGYAGPLDLSRLVRKSSQYFTEGEVNLGANYVIGDRVEINGIYVSSTSNVILKPLRNQGKITRILPQQRNPYLLDDGQLGWVNNQGIVRKVIVSQNQTYRVKVGETLSSIGLKLGISWQELARINNLSNPNLIYPGQELRY